MTNQEKTTDLLLSFAMMPVSLIVGALWVYRFVDKDSDGD